MFNYYMHLFYFELNSEWTYILNDNTGVGGASVPLPLSYISQDEAQNTLINFESIFTDFPDVSFIVYSFNATTFSDAGTLDTLSFGDNLCVRSMAALSSFAGGGSVDLTPVLSALTAIQTRVDMLPDFEASSAIVSSALQSLDAVEINHLHEDIVSLGTQLSTVTVPLQSLNGNGCEFIDGTTVTVYGRDDVVYAVSRSYMAMTDDNAYTAVYDLESINGAKCTAPESLLTLYVAPVVTP